MAIRRSVRWLGILLTCLAANASAAPGDLDASFGTGGIVRSAWGRSDDFAQAVAVAPDGKVVVVGHALVGTAMRFALVRYNADGSPDATFGQGGRVAIAFSSNQLTSDQAFAVAVQADGKPVVAGVSSNTFNIDTKFAVVRYNTDGTRDTSFGCATPGTCVGAFTDIGSIAGARAVLVQPDGKVVAVGHGRTGVNQDFAVVRYNANGTLDTDFGCASPGTCTGIVTTPIGSGSDIAMSVALQADGKLIVAGTDNADFAMVRYNTNGTIDTGFGSSGKVQTPMGTSTDVVNSVAIQADGKIVLAGRAIVVQNQLAVARYSGGGVLDNTFGCPVSGTCSGKLVSSQFGPATGLRIQADGKILLAATSVSDPGLGVTRLLANGSPDATFGTGGAFTVDSAAAIVQTGNALAVQANGSMLVVGASNYDFLVARVATLGFLDTTFGGTGKVVTDVDHGQQFARAVALQADGRIVVAGEVSMAPALARYTAAGAPDATFGSGGLVVPFNNGGDSLGALAVLGDGKIVAAGQSRDTGTGRFVLTAVRVSPGGALDTDFGCALPGTCTGIAKVTVNVSDDTFVTALAMQPDGKIVLAGYHEISFVPHFIVARLNSNGTPDTSFGCASPGTCSGYNVVQVGAGPSPSSAANAVIVLGDGKILLGGYAVSSGVEVFALARFNANGTVDTGFAASGQLRNPVGPTHARIAALLLQPNGRILAAGHANTGALVKAFALARFIPSGVLDSDFGCPTPAACTGMVVTQVGSAESESTAALLLSDGKILAAGRAFVGATDFALLRYNANGTLDGSFGSGGVVLTSLDNFDDLAYAVALQVDSKALVAGETEGRAGIVRYITGTTTVTTVGSGTNPSVYGQPVTFTATVFGNSPSGNVAFRDGGIDIAGCAAVPLVTATATCNVASLGVGSHSITVVFGGSPQNDPSTSVPLTQTVGKANSTTAIVGHTPVPSNTGQAVTVSVAVSAVAPGAGAPGGTVFVTDGVASCPVALPASSCQLTLFTVGTRTLSASYAGDANFLASNSAGVSHAVRNVTSTAVASNRNPANFGQSVTFTATVTGVTPTGTVAFLDGITPITGCGAVTASAGSAACSTAILVPGTHSITAEYSGDATNGPSTSPALSQVVRANLLVSRAGAGSGTVTSSPPGIDCGSDCTEDFAGGTSVALTATPAAGSSFAGWTGDCTGAGSCQVTMDSARSVTATFDVAAAPNPPRLANISTRMQVLTGSDVMIGGFVIGGSASKTVAIVATGPSLAQFGIANPLANPTLTLVRSSDQSVLATNDDWQSAPNAAQLTAAGFAPSSALEAAILVNLPPGAYTAIVQGVSNGTGVAVVGVYEVDGPTIPLINISTRGKVLTGNDVMIGGFVIQGSGPQTLAIVATGPSLAAFGIANPIANPTITLVRSSDQTVIATNDDWQADANASQLQAAGFAPSNALESGILITLQPGAYTAILSGVGGGTGVGVIGVYKVN